MAGWASYDLSAEILNFFYRGQVISIGPSLYLRLLVSPSSRDGGGTETNYSGYSRLELPRTTSGIWANAPSGGRLTNATVLTVGSIANSLGNGELNSFDIVDTPSGAVGKIYNGGPIVPPRTVVIGKTVKFRAGALLITF